MASGRARAGMLAVGLVFLLSGCEMTVRFDTTVDAAGGGAFSVGIHMDRELRRQLEDIDAVGTVGSGLSSLTAVFDRLSVAGWTSKRTEPDGGLSLEATRRFADPGGLQRALGELETARRDETRLELGSVRLRMDYGSEKSFFRSRARISGELDMTGGEEQDAGTRETIDALVGDDVRIEVRASMPGSIEVGEGGGVVKDGTVVWRPRLGDRLRFAARSSNLQLGSLLLVLIPVLLLLAAGWFALARRRRPGAEGDVMPEPVVPEPIEPAEPAAAEPVLPAGAAAASVVSPPLVPASWEPGNRIIELERSSDHVRPAAASGSDGGGLLG